MKNYKILLLLVPLTCFADFGQQQKMHNLQWQLDQATRSAEDAARASQEATQAIKDAEERRATEARLASMPKQPQLGVTYADAMKRKEALQIEQWRKEAEIEAAQVNARLPAKKRPTATQQETAQERYDIEVQRSKALAVKLYPEVAQPDSKLIKTMERLDDHWLEIGHPLYNDSNKPLILAEICALNLKVTPNLPKKPKNKD